MPDVNRVWSTPNGDKIIAYCARVSNPKNQQSNKYSKLIRYCADNRHWSIFETANLCLEIKTSRAISAQILRHRSFSFQEFSQRYATVDNSGIEIYAARRQDDSNRQNSIDDLPEAIKLEWEERQLDNWRRAFEHYTWALDHNIAKESARMVLPLQTSTTIYMNGTVRSWIHYIAARTYEGAQKEHRDLAESAKLILVKEYPIVGEALGWQQEAVKPIIHSVTLSSEVKLKSDMDSGLDNSGKA